MGPTASGKTDLSLKIVSKFSCEIISVDSVMIYKGMNIGSAKPSAEILHSYPHHLIDILDPIESYSAANFRADAIQLIREIHARNRTPLFVGGTMLYFSALQHGMSQMPSANQAVRKKISELADKKGWEYMHAYLAKIDSKAANRIHKNDPQRIQRALEVYELTGIPISDWHAKTNKPELPYSALKLALIPNDRTQLHNRIEQRFDRMIDVGFINEMKLLHHRNDLDDNFPSMRSVGYRQAWHYLDGEYDFETMREKVIVATRQLAKRQLTWLRSETNLTNFTAERYDIHDIYHKIGAHLR